MLERETAPFYDAGHGQQAELTKITLWVHGCEAEWILVQG